MKFLKGKKLLGVNQIMIFLNFRYLYTVHDLIIHRDLPARKEGGIWVAYVSDLKKWKADNPDVQETPSFQYERIQYRKVKTRWGLEKVEKRIIKNF